MHNTVNICQEANVTFVSLQMLITVRRSTKPIDSSVTDAEGLLVPVPTSMQMSPNVTTKWRHS